MRPRDKHGVTGYACFLQCHPGLSAGIAILSSTASFEVVFWTFDAEWLQLLDDALQFFGEWTIEYFVFTFPVEFQTAAVQKQAAQSELLFDFAVEGEIAVTRIA